MSTQALRQPAGQDLASNNDFMIYGYQLIKEPLNLWAVGQRWFSRIYEEECRTPSVGLALGATPWLASLLRRTQHRTIIVDFSRQMLDFTARETAGDPSIELVQGDWRDLPVFDQPLGAVVGDNSFSFLTFPYEWGQLCDELADRMRPGGVLMARVCSQPHGYRPLSVDAIVARFLAADSINYTEVRAMLLFSQWNRTTYAIDTEAVLDVFEASEHSFEPLFAKFPIDAENDLVTVKKYRRSGAVYYAPPLDELLHLMGKRFRVTSVHYGPYAMSTHFPLIVAVRK